MRMYAHICGLAAKHIPFTSGKPDAFADPLAGRRLSTLQLEDCTFLSLAAVEEVTRLEIESLFAPYCYLTDAIERN